MTDQIEDLSPLPFTGMPHLGESGKGFLLRMAELNGLELYEFHLLLRLDPKRAIRPQDAPVLARIFDCRASDFDDLVVHRNYATHYVQRHTFQGHLVTRLYLFDLRHPKVCPRCIEQYGFARAAWDFTLYLWCPIHQCLLAEHCTTCGKQLTWFRPGVATCVCRGRLVDLPENNDASWQVKVMAIAMTHQDDAGQWAHPALPPVCWQVFRALSALSIDGAMRLIWTLGIPQDADAGLARSRRRPNCAEAALIVERGVDHLLDLLQRVGAGHLGTGARVSLLLKALERMKEDGATAGDRQFAASIIESLFRPRRSHRPSNDEKQLALALEARQ